jgi:hypothetical protein
MLAWHATSLASIPVQQLQAHPWHSGHTPLRCCSALQAGLMKNRELSMTSSWSVSPEYLSTIYELGMREQQFGFSITPVDYMQARVELAAGAFLREDQTFYIMKSCRAPGGEQIYQSASHVMNEHGEVVHYQACMTKSPHEVVPGLTAVAGRLQQGELCACAALLMRCSAALLLCCCAAALMCSRVAAQQGGSAAE